MTARTKAGQAPAASYDVTAVLRQITLDPDATATAKAAAARTLAEMVGMVGRHQQAPDRRAAIPIGDLSRADLERELVRLRAACGAADKAPDKA